MPSTLEVERLADGTKELGFLHVYNILPVYIILPQYALKIETSSMYSDISGTRVCDNWV